MSNYQSVVKSNTRLLIITHASKNVSEQGLKDPLLYPGAPHTDLLEKVLNNLEQRLNLVDAVISFDHKIDCPISRSYFDNLRNFCSNRGIRLVLSPSSLLMSNQLTATSAFKRGIDAIDSDYVLFFEHDHLFRSDLDWQIVDRAFNGGAQMLRFNRRVNQSDPNSIEVIRPCTFMQEICETNKYCNGPFLAKTRFCAELFELGSQQVPTWNGMFGGFVEGPVGRQMIADEFNMGYDKFREKYPIYLYGPINAAPLIDHFGDFPGRRARWARHLKRLLRSYW